MSSTPKPVGGSEEALNRGLPRAVIILVGLGAAIFALIGLRQLSWLIGPVFLAMVIVILVHPLHGWLRRYHVPSAVALVLLLVSIYGTITVIVVVVAVSLARLVGLLPEYAAELEILLQDLRDRLAVVGIGPEQARALTSMIEPSRAVQAVTAVLAQVVSFGANVVLLLSLLLFMGVDSTGVRPRMTSITAQRPLFAGALRSFAVKTRRFLGVTTVFGLITGFADTLLLLWLDIPLAVLWGLLAALCNYIPYVGFVIGVIPPAVLALLIGGLPLMLVVIISYILLNSLFTSLIQPYFVGDAVGVSTTMTLVSLVLWGWVLGALGAILAIPLTLLCKAVLVDADPRATWVNALIGSGRTDRRTPAIRLPRLKRRRTTTSETPEAAKPPIPAPDEPGTPGTPRTEQK